MDIKSILDWWLFLHLESTWKCKGVQDIMAKNVILELDKFLF